MPTADQATSGTARSDRPLAVTTASSGTSQSPTSPATRHQPVPTRRSSPRTAPGPVDLEGHGPAHRRHQPAGQRDRRRTRPGCGRPARRRAPRRTRLGLALEVVEEVEEALVPAATPPSLPRPRPVDERLSTHVDRALTDANRSKRKVRHGSRALESPAHDASLVWGGCTVGAVGPGRRAGRPVIAAGPGAGASTTALVWGCAVAVDRGNGVAVGGGHAGGRSTPPAGWRPRRGVPAGVRRAVLVLCGVALPPGCRSRPWRRRGRPPDRRC